MPINLFLAHSPVVPGILSTKKRRMDLGHNRGVLKAPAHFRMNDVAGKSLYIQSRKMAETTDNGKCHTQWRTQQSSNQTRRVYYGDPE